MKNKVQFANPAGDYRRQKTLIDRALKRELAQGAYIRGRAVDDFEKAFAAELGAKCAVGVASGTDALLLGLRALGIGPGDEVITVANTFVATAFAIALAGAKPILVDAERATLNMDASLLERVITPKTRAVIPVHLFGQPADLGKIMIIARKHKIEVIEDACQAHGAAYKGRKAGSFGLFSAFSFYPTKNLGAAGDAGAVVTNNAGLAGQIRALGNYASLTKNIHEWVGYNSRMDTLQARILEIKLKRLEANNRARQKIAKIYDRVLGDEPKIIPLTIKPDRTCVYHLYVIRVPGRDQVRERLTKTGIPTLVHYPTPIHLQPAFAHLGYQVGDFPVAEEAAKTMISLPMHPYLTQRQAEWVAKQVVKAVRAS